MDELMTSEERAAGHRAWLTSFGFTDADWAKIKAQAERVAAGANEASLTDLDAPFRVLAVRKTERHRPNGDVLGAAQDCVLLFWRL
jgi:hypothetical protein